MTTLERRWWKLDLRGLGTCREKTYR